MVEARSPFLDQELVEYCASLPVRYKVQNGEGKLFLKQLAERYYPVEFVYRSKKGFSIPLAHWLRGPLRPILIRYSEDPELMTPLSQSVINKLLREFIEEGIDYASRMWSLLMFGMWQRNRQESVT